MLELTAETEQAAQAQTKTPQLILDIEGIELVFTLTDVLKLARYGDGNLYDTENFYYGVPYLDSNVRSYITKDGTTSNMTQQIDTIEATSSISNISVKLIDLDNSVSELFYNTDVFTKKANVYLSFKNLEHPKNSVRIFSGIINGIDYGAGNVKLQIDNPSYLKVKKIFTETKAKLTLAVNDTDTTISVDNTNDYILSQDAISSYIRLEDEIIKVGSITSTDFLNCTRGQLGTLAIAHDVDADVSSLYRLQGNSLELALKLMLSSGGEYQDELSPLAFNSLNGDTINGLFFDLVDVNELLGLTAGDLIQITNSISNDGIYTINGGGKLSDNTSFITVDETLTTEDITGVITSFKSKYDVLPIGCSMRMDEVDVVQFEFILDSYLRNAPDLDFNITEIKTADDFINKELFLPVGAYSLPRKGQASVGYTSPPVASGKPVYLDDTNIVGGLDIVLKRSAKDKFFNNVIYKYGFNTVLDKFLSINQTISGESVSKYRAGSTPLIIESNGMIEGSSTTNFIESAASRLLERYRFGAEFFTLDTTYEIGFKIEAGDTVVVDGTNIKLYDSKTGKRDTFFRIMEVVNKSINITTGKVSLTVVDTAFKTVGRYATISPSSYTIANTTNVDYILVKNVFSGEPDALKWSNYIGSKLKLFITGSTMSPIYVTVKSVDQTDPTKVFIEETVYIDDELEVTFDEYPALTQPQKLLHAAMTGSVLVNNGTTDTVFSLNGGFDKPFAGGNLVVSSPDYTRISPIVKVLSVNNNNGEVVVDSSLGFIPQSNDQVEFVGFASDEADSYIIL